MKDKLKKAVKKAGKPVMNSIFEFLMRGAKKHGGRKLFDASELKLLREALLTQNLFSMDGYMVKNFEEEFARTYGAPYAVASTSGTAAIHTALGALDLNAGDEVITAPITDLGTIIPILYQNLIPVFADTDETYQMDPADVEKKITPRTKAIIAVHLFGNACDMDAMSVVAKRHNIPLIEDCSQAHLTEYKGKFVGTIGDIGCFSFQQSKHMTTGDGGMTITSNKKYYERMKLFVDKGYARKGWGSRAYLFHAPNYRMNELTAAVGRAQLKKVKAVVEKRNEMGRLMTELLTGVPGVTPAPVTPGTKHSFWLYPFKLEDVDLEKFCKEMISKGVYAMAGYTGKTIYLCTESLSAKKTYGNSELPFSWRKDKNFEYKEGLCPKAEKALETLVCIPWNESWGEAGVVRAANVIKECLEKANVSLRGGASATTKQSMRSTAEIASSSAKEQRTSRNDISKHEQKIRVAIIGCGQIGRWHLDAYKQNKNVALVACVDTDLGRAKSFASEVGARAYSSHKEMLKNEELDGVSLCTLPCTHPDVAIDILDAGVNVLCEKPLAIRSEDARRMLKKASEKNKLLLTAFKLRFHEEVLKVKEIIDQGGLGNLLSFRIIFGGYMDMSSSWHVKKELSGGGVLMDNGPHAVDLVHYLLGDVESVSASAVDSKGLGVEDTVKLNFILKNGMAGTIDLSWALYVTPGKYLEVYGDGGAALADLAGVTYKFNDWKEWKRADNKADEHGAFAAQIDHFVNAVRSGKTSAVDAGAGLKAQEIIENIYRELGDKSHVRMEKVR